MVRKNWDAFWDLIRSECAADKVVITGEHSLSKELDESLAIMHEVLERNITLHKEAGLDPFSYEIVD